MTSTFRAYWRDDGIRVNTAEDTSLETVQDWEQDALAKIAAYSGPQKRLYDLRRLKRVSIYALRSAIRIKAHPNARLARVAVLANSAVVVRMVNVALSVQPGGHFRLFTDEETAVAWLHNQ
ncbi:STAS/SEC14 domain-containing protein [Candidatus Leptofilum sp.]|uniref:STAS/SEC14 domain-containing protein n=1 Tax=Candidatus Leptofilum sp. TaxID=3241576 RepID=UPI003B5B8F69